MDILSICMLNRTVDKMDNRMIASGVCFALKFVRLECQTVVPPSARGVCEH